MINKVPETENCFASVDGKVFRMLKDGSLKEVKPYYRKDGYGVVVLKTKNKRKTFYVHRCICSAFKIKDKPDVNHIDGVKSNNHILNLEWVTKKENEFHAKLNKLKAYGVKNSQHKLRESQVVEIRKSSEPSRLLAIKFNVSKTTILNIKNNKVRMYCGVK